MARKLTAVLLVIGAVATGCGTDQGSKEAGGRHDATAAREARQQAKRVAAKRRAQRAQATRRAAARARRQAAKREARREARREAARQQARERARAQAIETEEAEEAEEAEATESECDPNYEGACLDPYASDYDCEGGSGDGPAYTGPVTVVGSDRHGLDSDGDGSACETY